MDILYLWILKISNRPNPHRLLLNLSEKINLKRSDKYLALQNRNIYYTGKNIKNPHANNTFKTSAAAWNEEVEYLHTFITNMSFGRPLDIVPKSYF